MAATTTASFLLGATQSPAVPLPGSTATRQRRIDPQAGRALELLGHAIEYLADEFVHQGGQMKSGDAQVEAMQLLMALNRQVYLDCPVVPTLAERCATMFRRVTH